jgi:hypothetical protein
VGKPIFDNNSRVVEVGIRGADQWRTFTENGVRTVKNLDLGLQSVDVKDVSAQYPHLKNIERVGSMKKVRPMILIGEDKGHLFDVRRPMKGPSVTQTRLGWMIHGQLEETGRRSPEVRVFYADVRENDSSQESQQQVPESESTAQTSSAELDEDMIDRGEKACAVDKMKKQENPIPHVTPVLNSSSVKERTATLMESVRAAGFIGQLVAGRRCAPTNTYSWESWRALVIQCLGGGVLRRSKPEEEESMVSGSLTRKTFPLDSRENQSKIETKLERTNMDEERRRVTDGRAAKVLPVEGHFVLEGFQLIPDPDEPKNVNLIETADELVYDTGQTSRKDADNEANNVLTATLKELVPREEVLQTLLVEAENIVNSRPLTHVSVDPDDPESLTPNHFLIGTSNGNAAPGKFAEMDLCLRKQWRIAQRLVDRFWKRWVQEYLPTLTRRTKWFRKTGPVKIGDLVFIADGNLPRNQWPRGLVVGTTLGPDGQVRVAEVKTQFGFLARHVVKLCVLDVKKDVD